MAVFAFEAMDNKGRKVRKEIEAPGRNEAIAKIKGLGFHPTAIKPVKRSGRTSQKVEKESGSKSARRSQKKTAPARAAAPSGAAKQKRVFGRVKLGELTQFTNQLSTLQDAGLPIVRSLRILEGQLKVSVLKYTILDVANEVESGSSLSDALSKHPKVFDRLYTNMIKAGELGGVLDTILDRLAGFMEKSLRLRKKVIGALVYPAVVSTVAIGILLAIMKFVVPKFAEMFVEMDLPLPMPTEMLMGFSKILESYWMLIILFPFLCYGTFIGVGRTRGGRLLIDRFKLYMPLFGTIIRKSTVARFCRTLGTLLASGVPVLEALAILKDATGNEIVAGAIDNVHSSIREGESIARPLGESGVFDDIIVNMVDIGEETGELDKMLIKVADNYEADVDVAVEALTSVMEPLLIVFMGGAVGFIVVSLFMPLISLIEGIG